MKVVFNHVTQYERVLTTREEFQVRKLMEEMGCSFYDAVCTLQKRGELFLLLKGPTPTGHGGIYPTAVVEDNHVVGWQDD